MVESATAPTPPGEGGLWHICAEHPWDDSDPCSSGCRSFCGVEIDEDPPGGCEFGTVDDPDACVVCASMVERL